MAERALAQARELARPRRLRGAHAGVTRSHDVIQMHTVAIASDVGHAPRS